MPIIRKFLQFLQIRKCSLSEMSSLAATTFDDFMAAVAAASVPCLNVAVDAVENRRFLSRLQRLMVVKVRWKICRAQSLAPLQKSYEQHNRYEIERGYHLEEHLVTLFDVRY